MNRMAQAAPLTLVRGTFGSGKSVLLVQWASRLQARGEDWLFLDCRTLDGSFAALLAELHERIQRRFGAGQTDPVESPIEAIHRALAQRTTPVTVLIDHVSTVGDPRAEELMLDLLERYRLLRIVAATRAAAQLDPLTLGARIDVTTIRQAELYFTSEETERAIVAITGHPVPRALNTGLYPSPVVTRLVGLGIDQELERLRAVGRPVPDGEPAPDTGVLQDDRVAKTLFDLYFGEAEIADIVRSYLLLSFVPTVTAAEAVAITGTENALRHLSQAICDDLGEWETWPGEDEPRFRFVERWRRLFLNQAMIRFGGDLPRIKQSLMRIAMENARYVDALDHAVDLGELEIAARALRAGWTRFTGASAARVHEILLRLSERELESSAVLSYYLALMTFAVSPGPRVSLLLNRVARKLDRRDVDDQPAEALWTFAVLSTSYRLLGDSGRAARRAHRALAIAERLGAVDREQLGENGPMLLQSCGFSLATDGDSRNARRALELAEAFAGSRYPLSSFHGRGHLAALAGLRGEMASARAVLRRIEQSSPPPEWTGNYFGAGYGIARAIEALERLAPDAAAAELDLVRPNLPHMEHWVLFTVADGLTQVVLGRPAEALARIDVALASDRLPAPSAHSLSSLQTVRALAILATGRVEGALQQLAALRKPSRTSAVTLALALLVSGQPERAKAVLGDIVDPAKLGRQSRNTALGLLLSAVASHRLGLFDAASDGCREAIAVMRSTQGLLPLVFVPHADLAELAESLSGEDRDFLDDFLSHGVGDTLRFPAAQRAAALTKRERLLLGELTRGDSIPKIAQRLGVSPNTVKAQLRSVYRKLGVASRQDAVREATETGLFD